MQPALTPKKRRGRPNFLKSRKSSRQLGWGTIATRNPSASRIRPITAAPKDGWSTYASPLNRITSNSFQPRNSTSFLVVGNQSVSRYSFMAAKIGN